MPYGDQPYGDKPLSSGTSGASIGGYSPSAGRIYTFQDLIASLRQDAENAGNPLLDIDTAFTLLTVIGESGHFYDSAPSGSVTATTATHSTWGSGKWGFDTWQ